MILDLPKKSKHFIFAKNQPIFSPQKKNITITTKKTKFQPPFFKKYNHPKQQISKTNTFPLVVCVFFVASSPRTKNNSLKAGRLHSRGTPRRSVPSNVVVTSLPSLVSSLVGSDRGRKERENDMYRSPEETNQQKTRDVRNWELFFLLEDLRVF